MASTSEESVQVKTLSHAAKQRMASSPGEPLFIADWEKVLMIHYQVDPHKLQKLVPFELDLLDGSAFISIVAFTMRGMRPRFGGHLGALLLKPIATHEFLNVRTYVRNGSETGIYFLAEWLSNRLSVAIGPRAFGLPYVCGRLDYQHRWQELALGGCVVDAETQHQFTYHGALDHKLKFAPCGAGSVEEWLMERYTAYTHSAGCERFFRVWHPPWQQMPVEIKVTDQSLLNVRWPLFRDSHLLGSNFSPGVGHVWMGRPHRLHDAEGRAPRVPDQ